MLYRTLYTSFITTCLMIPFSFSSIAGFAQVPVPELVKDIRAGSSQGIEKFNNVGMLDSLLLFTANDGISGEEPYVTNGTPAGTRLLKDIRSGAQSSIPTGTNADNFSGFAILNGKAIFAANNGSIGIELWMTDGTEAGTVVLKDIVPGASGSDPRDFYTWNGRLLFTAATPELGRELWISDGTTAGTILLKDIYTALAGTGSNPSEFVAWGDSVFFTATAHDTGRELWVTDGTPAGTQLFRNIAVETAWWISLLNSNPAGLAVFNNKLYFSAAGDGGNDRELWVSDGTAAGTQLLKNINTAPESGSLPQEFTVFNNQLFFRANDGNKGTELWVTDGTASGTRLVKDLVPGATGSDPTNFFVFNQRLVFAAYNALFGYFTWWISDGTSGGTEMYNVLYPNLLFGASNTLRPTVVGTHAFLPASPHGAPAGSVYDFRLFMIDPQWEATPLLPISWNQNAQIPTRNGLHPLRNHLLFRGNYLSSISAELYHVDIAPFVQLTATWTGSAGSNWHDPANWSTGKVPDAQTLVIINPGSAPCIVSAADAHAKSINVAALAEFRVINGRQLLLSGR